MHLQNTPLSDIAKQLKDVLGVDEVVIRQLRFGKRFNQTVSTHEVLQPKTVAELHISVRKVDRLDGTGSFFSRSDAPAPNGDE